MTWPNAMPNKAMSTRPTLALMLHVFTTVFTAMHEKIIFTKEIYSFWNAKVGVLRDSHYLFSTPYREFE
jgi:isoprenylcysteine carboxyl methyltransferase (ICMT) family protein YpbQ